MELAQGSLIGNTFHVGVIARLHSHLMQEWNFLSRAAIEDVVADPWQGANFNTDHTPAGVQGEPGAASLNMAYYWLYSVEHCVGLLQKRDTTPS